MIFFVRHFFASAMEISHLAGYSWAALASAITLLYMSRRRVFPPVVIVVREARSFLRRNVSELSFVAALLSLVLTIIGFFVDK